MDKYVVREGSSMTDLYRTDERYERELQSIRNWPIGEKDRQIFLDFLHSMQARGIGFVQLLKYVQGMKTFLKNYNKSYNELTRQDLERFLISMQQLRLKPKTQHIRWYSVKKFFDFIGLGSCFFKVRFEKTRHKLPEEILTEDEVDAMIDVVGDDIGTNFNKLQKQCFIAVLYESGCRIGELMMLTPEAVKFDENGAVLLINGKTGQRRIRIVKHARLLQKYILDNNIPKNSRVFNFQWHTAAAILREAAAGAGITKRIYPHLLRHSRATHLASALSDQQLKQFFGWTGGSEMAAVYVHLSGRDIDSAIINYYRERGDFEKMKDMGIG